MKMSRMTSPDAGGGGLNGSTALRVVVRLKAEDQPRAPCALASAPRGGPGPTRTRASHGRATYEEGAANACRHSARPHGAEHAQLDVVRLAAEAIDDRVGAGSSVRPWRSAGMARVMHQLRLGGADQRPRRTGHRLVATELEDHRARRRGGRFQEHEQGAEAGDAEPEAMEGHAQRGGDDARRREPQVRDGQHRGAGRGGGDAERAGAGRSRIAVPRCRPRGRRSASATKPMPATNVPPPISEPDVVTLPRHRQLHLRAARPVGRRRRRAAAFPRVAERPGAGRCAGRVARGQAARGQAEALRQVAGRSAARRPVPGTPPPGVARTGRPPPSAPRSPASCQPGGGAPLVGGCGLRGPSRRCIDRGAGVGQAGAGGTPSRSGRRRPCAAMSGSARRTGGVRSAPCEAWGLVPIGAIRVKREEEDDPAGGQRAQQLVVMVAPRLPWPRPPRTAEAEGTQDEGQPQAGIACRRSTAGGPEACDGEHDEEHRRSATLHEVGLGSLRPPVTVG